MAWQDPWNQIDKANALRAQSDMQGINMLSAMQGAQTNALQQQQLRTSIDDEMAIRDAYKTSNGDPVKLREALTGRGLHKQIQALDAADLAKREKESVIGKNLTETKVKEAGLFRDNVAQIADQAGWDALRQSLGERGARLPAQFDPKVQAFLVRKADDVVKQQSPNYKVVGGALVDTNSFTNPTIGQYQITPTIAEKETGRHNVATEGLTARGQNMTDSRSREANAISKEAQQTQLVNDPNQGLLLVNKGTKVATPATFANGSPVPSEAAVSANKMNRQLQTAISTARELIPKATSSGAGAQIDSAMGYFGQSTPGADAASQLDTLAGWMVSNVPRMQGPQSDKDVMLYRQMAAQVGDRNQPTSRRLAALDTLEELQKKYSDINATPYEKAGGAPAGKPAAGKIKFLGFEDGKK